MLPKYSSSSICTQITLGVFLNTHTFSVKPTVFILNSREDVNVVFPWAILGVNSLGKCCMINIQCNQICILHFGVDTLKSRKDVGNNMCNNVLNYVKTGK